MAKRKRTSIRNRHVSFRLSAEEHFRLLDKAQHSGLSVGDFLRTRALGSRRRRPGAAQQLSALPQHANLAIQLRKIGVNVNQIAHHCNRHLVPPPADLQPLLTEIRSLLKASFGPSTG